MTKTAISAFLTLILICFACGCAEKNSDTGVVSGDPSGTAELTSGGESDGESGVGKTVGDDSAGGEQVSFGYGETSGDSESHQIPESGAEPVVYTENFTYGECLVTLRYPRFGDEAHVAFDEYIRDNAVKNFRSDVMSPDGASLYEVSFTDITYVSEKLVSAVSAGRVVNTDSGRESYFSYTVNVDPVSGRAYLSDELIADLDKIKEGLASGEFAETYGVPGVLNEISVSDMTVSWRSDYGIFPDVYFGSDSFGVLAELPAALGGYAGFEMGKNDAISVISPAAEALWN